MATLEEIQRVAFGASGMNKKRRDQLSAWHRKGAGIEAPIDPHLPIIDAHHHLMEHKLLDAWDSDSYPQIPGNERLHNLSGLGFKCGFGSVWLEDDHLADARGNNVKGTVFVETNWSSDTDQGVFNPVGETRRAREAFEYCVKRNSETKLCSGIVARLDFLNAGAQAVDIIRAHEAAGAGLLKGIRYSLSGDPFVFGSTEVLAAPMHVQRYKGFRECLSLLGRLGLTYDCWLFHTNIKQLAEAARACPGTTIVCNHAAYPLGIGPYADKARRHELFTHWSEDMKELAQCSNVYCKVGGLTQYHCQFGEPVPWGSLERDEPPSSQEIADTLAPWYHHCINTFGPQRCMFESNWPLDRAGCSYTNLWNAFKRLAKVYGPADQLALFHDTAVQVYNLTNSRL